MALISYQQTDNDAGFDAACSAGTTNGDAAGRDATPGGTAGSTGMNFDPGNSATRRILSFTMPAPGVASWADGDWVIRINPTSGSSNTDIRHYWVCDWDGATTYVEVCSQLSVNDVTTGGVITRTIAQGGDYTPQSVANSQPVVVISVLGAAHGTTAITITPDQIIDSPIDDGVGGAVKDILGGTGILPWAR